ncbi:MAG: hypothetical protein AMJ81_07225 [Phycisphaerae bacterium SM23_33]|nr:MAG: hypothetical protein AMJ81_07225 [Phycisphaerae bacterium SM23_33]
MLVGLFGLLVALAGRADGEQVKGLGAFHRSGQTFLTWQAVETYGELSAEQRMAGGLEAADHKRRLAERDKADKAKTGVRYWVYRSAKPIADAASLAAAEKVGEVAPLSIYYPGRNRNHWRSALLPTVCIEDEKPLPNGAELFVHTLDKQEKPGKFYYAVLVARAGEVDRTIGKGNSLAPPVAEASGEPQPVLQRIRPIGPKEHYMYQEGPAEVRYYLRWVHEPYSNLPRVFIWAVAVPGKYDPSQPAALQVMVHGWGGSQDAGTYWYGVGPSCIRISSMNDPVQDWWYGYHEDLGIRRLRPDGVIRNYTERRVLSMMDWVRGHWKIDPNRIFIEGQSMGGTGALHIGGKRGELFAYVNSWVGIACWPDNGWFRNGEQSKWGERYQYMNYNGAKFDEWMDLAWWLRKYPTQETPFFSFANGKNDGAIGWEQAVKFVRALQETKRAFVFRWGLGGHSERAIFMFDPRTMALDKSLPAFVNCSLDDDLGTARKLPQPKTVPVRNEKPRQDPFDGDSAGQINSHLRWEDAADEKDRYEVTIFLTSGQHGAPKEECTVDMTPRRCQNFKAAPGERFKWTNTSVPDGKEVQSGAAVADQLGLVTLEQVKVAKGKNRIKIFR